MRPACVVLALLLPVAASGASLKDIGDLLRAGALEDALAGVAAHLGERPFDADARFLHARILAELGRDEAAIDIYEELRVQFPRRPELYNNLAVLYARRGDLERAAKTLEQAFDTSETFARVRDNLRAIYAALAAEAYRKALAGTGEEAGGEESLQLEPVEFLAQPLATTAGAPPLPAQDPSLPSRRATLSAATAAHPAEAAAGFDRGAGASPAVAEGTGPVAGQ